MKKFSEMSLDELKEEAQMLRSMIYDVDCYSTHDMINLEMIEHEIYKREEV